MIEANLKKNYQYYKSIQSVILETSYKEYHNLQIKLYRDFSCMILQNIIFQVIGECGGLDSYYRISDEITSNTLSRSKKKILLYLFTRVIMEIGYVE